MTAQSIYAAPGLAVVFFIALFGGYQVGADAAERDNRRDAATVTTQD